jgi:tripartite-type tricarboxylate transporter receptor subunit TctC
VHGSEFFGSPEVLSRFHGRSVSPAPTPRERYLKLARWFSAAVRAPDISRKLAVQEFYPVGACGADFATYLRKQYASLPVSLLFQVPASSPNEA